MKGITKYFENILKQETAIDLPEITPQKSNNPITTKEMKDVIKKVKNNRLAGSKFST